MLPVEIDDLPRLARRVNEAHFQVQYHAKGMLVEARKAGEHLKDAKSRLPHGAFLPWLEKECPGVTARTAQRYMRVADIAAEKSVNLVAFDGGLVAFLDAYAGRKAKSQPAPATPTFTREDAEYALKIHARVEGGLECERDVAATKLAKVAEGFGMDPETLVTKAYELCPDTGVTESEATRLKAEELAKAALAELARRDAILADMKARYASATKDELITILADLKARNVWKD